ncbi:hypothetical protein KP509_32G064700 [Ceratopteris richardii]|uniref:Reverse transcriptase domain-containing protein n=1 Tax=Ceratopteris richardii TaxID=49495 RepID=A0A8T2QW01_CERRI|nr:hypothetical protein KP509_32G064700 [Ceratopteris richardii]
MKHNILFPSFKRLKDVISRLEVDGLTINDGGSIAAFCSEHFRKLFAASYKSDDAWFQALHESLQHTPPLLDSQMADACEKSMSEEEVFMALKSLKNGKAPSLDGITKEFVMAFWPLLKNLVLDVCNEVWKDQKMPYTFKLGKIKLIPKSDVPRCIGDWRPITMMSIIYKIFAKQIAMGFADDTFIFARVDNQNIRCILETLAPFSEASSLKINTKKSAIVNISAKQFQSLKWEGPRFEKGIDVPIKDKLAWVLCRVKCKMEKWIAPQWPLHARIKIVQTFMQSYIMYYLLLLDWKKSQLHAFDRLLKNFLWNKKHSRALVLSSWQYVCQPRVKVQGG